MNSVPPTPPERAGLPAGAGALASVPDAVVRAAVEQADVALLVVDPAGRVVYAGGRAMHVPPAAVVGRPLDDLVEDEEGRGRLRRALHGHGWSGATVWGGRHWLTSYRPVAEAGELRSVVVLCHDVTDALGAGVAAAEEGRHLRTVLDTADEAIVVLDRDARLLWVNASCASQLPHLRPGVLMPDLLDDLGVGVLQDQIRRRAAGHRDRYQLRTRDSQGQEVWLQVAASPYRGPDGTVVGSVAVLSDITATKQRELLQAALARTDALTGVASRLTLTDRLQHVLSRRRVGPVGLLFCDVDGLKAVNDRFGHARGDELLRHVSSGITAALRPADTVARYGGDEFVVVCEDLRHPDEAHVLAERIRQAVARPLGDPPLAPSVSIGVATAPPHETAQALLAAADAAAYAAKRARRDQEHPRP